MNLDDIRKASDPKARMQRRMQELNIPWKDCHIDDDLNVSINTNNGMSYHKILEIKRMAKSVNVIRMASFNTGDIPVTSFELFPRYVSSEMSIPACTSLHGIHKYVKYIGGRLNVGRRSDLLPSHMLGIGMIEGPFEVGTINSDLNKLFDQYIFPPGEVTFIPLNQRDILQFQDKLIDAGFTKQAQF